jgi:hypothetical protein
VTDTQLVTGKAADDSAPFRGWLIGHFIPPSLSLRSTDDVEVKWGVHAVGDARQEWGANDATTLSVLVRGCIRYEFGDGQAAVLEKAGDYALWGAGLSHRWYIEREETVVLTVRWPSRWR